MDPVKATLQFVQIQVHEQKNEKKILKQFFF